MLIWVSACCFHIAGSPTISYCLETVQGAALCSWQFVSWFQLIFSDFAMTFYLLCPSLTSYGNAPAPQLEAVAPDLPCQVTEVPAVGTPSPRWLTRGKSSSLGQITFTWTLAANSSLNQSATLQSKEVQVSSRLIPQDWHSTEQSCCLLLALPWDTWLCGGNALAMRIDSWWAHPHGFSTAQKGWLELPLLCLWICLYLESNQKHSHSQAQLRRD